MCNLYGTFFVHIDDTEFFRFGTIHITPQPHQTHCIHNLYIINNRNGIVL